MSSPRFLVAKYTPDLRRMEPRNIGVVVWSDGRIAARFAGEHTNGTAKIDPPTHLHVQSKSVYRKWIAYWREILARPALPDETGRTIDRREPEFVNLIRGKSKQQFRLVDGGEFLQAIPNHDLDSVTDELFQELVAIERDPHTHERTEAAQSVRAGDSESD